ncbi:MAG: response regulator [Pseudomonadota bacterium]
MKTVLIIEDNEADQFLGELTIQRVRPDVQVLKAADGQEALDMLAENGIEPDLILLDINMPRMNGHEFLEAYSNNNERQIPVVVMLTSSDQERDKEQASGYHCVKDYLLKPIKPETVEDLQKIYDKAYASE